MEIPAPTPLAVAPRWNFATRVAFRFCFAYFVLYIFPFPLGYIPYSDYLFHYVFTWHDEFWNAVVPWVGEHVLHLSYAITILPNGSGDTTWDYVQVLCMVVIAGVLTILWSLLDRRRLAYLKLYPWLRLLVRLALGAVLIGYGLDKVVPLQMGQPSLLTLTKNFGDIPPGGLLWSFIGASQPFEIITGLVETVGGLLLIYPRTAVPGAIIGFISMTFVLLLNLCYDIPVKLYSFHLLCFSIFLLAPELGRFYRLLHLGERVELTKPAPLFTRRWLNHGLFVLQIAFGLVQFHYSLNANIEGAESFGFLAPSSPFYGIWSVDEFTMDGKVQPPLLTDETRWRLVIFDKIDSVDIRVGNHTVLNFGLAMSADKKTLLLSNDKKSKSVFSLQKSSLGQMTLTGDLDGHHLEVKLTRLDEGKFILPTRGFHWINEHPYFR